MTWKTFAIDEKSVEESDHTWQEMYYKQLRVAGCWLALCVLAVYFEGIGWWTLLVLPTIPYVFWPAIGARHYARGGQ